jgi:hypothetical protein
MAFLDLLKVNDSPVTSNLAAINNNSANTNGASQLLSYTPPQFGFNSNLNFPHPHMSFLDALSQYAAAVPLRTFWVVQFKIPNLIVEQNLKDLSETFRNNDSAKLTLSNDKFMRNIGCIFCRSFNFTGENNNSSVPEMDVRGFRSVPYAGGRNSAFLSNLNLTFYESTISFIDHIIRPWVILMSYYSTIARNDAVISNNSIYDLKQDVTCHLMSRTGVGKTEGERQANQQINSNTSSAIPNFNNPWTARKTIVFKNCFPKDMGTLEYAQGDNNSLETVNTTFCYTNYEVSHVPIAIQQVT